jgi:hypothetical protein
MEAFRARGTCLATRRPRILRRVRRAISRPCSSKSGTSGMACQFCTPQSSRAIHDALQQAPTRPTEARMSLMRPAPAVRLPPLCLAFAGAAVDPTPTFVGGSNGRPTGV